MNGFDAYQIGRRATGAGWILVAAFGVLIGAFFRTQIVQHDKFRMKSETNRLRSIPLEPPRGEIVDRNGELIAENLPGFSVKLLATSPDSLRAVLARFSSVVSLDSFEVDEAMRRYRNARYQPVVVRGNATFEEVSRLEEHRAMLPGLIIQSEPKRFYPQGRAVAHLIGYAGEVTETDLAQNRFPDAVLGSLVGKAGLERQYDSVLRGRAGVRYAEVNARGRLVREDVGQSMAPIAGMQLRTTLDLGLQRYIDSIWPAGVRGAMVAMTPDGKVRALYSAPSYDPNVFVGGIDIKNWRMLNGDSAVPLLNRAINGRYPPASTFKLATEAAALTRGLITFNTRMPVPCRGGIQYGNRVFHCWKHDGHGSLTLTEAIAASCDVYFYQVGMQLGLRNLLEDGTRMGFHDKSGIDLPSEQSPLYPSSLDYFTKRYGKNWSAAGATALNFAIGQGENDQTLINMVQFYAALAGGGIERTPYLVHASDTTERPLGLDEKELLGLRLALTAVAEAGTASNILRATVGKGQVLTIAGKTGTAQNAHGLDHRWFIAMAPAEHPQLVVGGIMENVGLHDPMIVRNIILALRRYVLGPDSMPDAKVIVRANESFVADSGPGPVDVVGDSAPPATRDSGRAAPRADSARRGTP